MNAYEYIVTWHAMQAAQGEKCSLGSQFVNSVSSRKVGVITYVSSESRW